MPHHAQKNVLGKTSSLPDLTNKVKMILITFCLLISRHPKSLINLPLRKALIKFPFLTSSLPLLMIIVIHQRHIFNQVSKRKPTYSDDEQTLINPTSKRKDDTTNFDTTVVPTSSIGAFSKSIKPQQDRKSSTDPKDAQGPKKQTQ